MTGRTPLARVGDPGPWRFEGACVSADDPSLWFAGADEPGQTVATIRKQREAVEICRGCPVLDECLDYALGENERFGIWGGLLPSQRQKLRRGRRKLSLKEQPERWIHGSLTAYTYGCRCDACLAGYADYRRRRRSELRRSADGHEENTMTTETVTMPTAHLAEKIER